MKKSFIEDASTQPHSQMESLAHNGAKHTISEHKDVHLEPAHNHSESMIAEDKSFAASSAAMQKSVAGAKAVSSLNSSSLSTSDDYLMRPKQALPHHIPKFDALSNKLEDIRKTMGDNGMKAPWDLKGRPLV
jgi:hypothetical protein